MEDKIIIFDGFKGEFIDPSGITILEEDVQYVELKDIEFDKEWK